MPDRFGYCDFEFVSISYQFEVVAAEGEGTEGKERKVKRVPERLIVPIFECIRR